MMKIRNCLLVSISYFSLCSLAQADLSAVENEFIFTHTSNNIHLNSQLQLLSSSNLPQTLSEYRDFSAPISLAVTERIKRRPFASVCFITDAGNCSGNKYGGANSPDNSSGGTPGGGGSSSGGDEWDNPFPPEEACRQLGYTLSSCNPGESPDDFCPADRSFFKKCTCTENCPKGYQKTPCGSGMLQTDVTIPNCQTCYRCTACKDDCPQGYDTSKGVCNEVSTHLTECGNICYKIISNECSDGSLTAPQETENQKNKIVGYTDCGNPCFKSFDDTCPAGYNKIPAATGKCYDTAITSFGSTCRKEKPCCQEACPSGSYEYDPGGTGSCGGRTTRNGCNTKTCYYPRYKCPCEDSAYTNCKDISSPVCEACFDANSVIWTHICKYSVQQTCTSMDQMCNTQTYSNSYNKYVYYNNSLPWPC